MKFIEIPKNQISAGINQFYAENKKEDFTEFILCTLFEKQKFVFRELVRDNKTESYTFDETWTFQEIYENTWNNSNFLEDRRELFSKLFKFINEKCGTHLKLNYKSGIDELQEMFNFNKD